MKQQAYKVKSKQVLRKARAKTIRSFKLKLIAFMFLLVISYHIFPYKLFNYLNKVGEIFPQFNLFSLHEVEIIGNEKYSYEELIGLTYLNEADNIFHIDLNLIKSELEKNSWIDEVTIQRIIPSKIRVEIKERKPRAIWFEKNKFFLVDIKGNILEEVPDNKVNASYLLLVGTNARFSYQEILDQLFHNGISGQVLSLARIGDRRWDIYLQSGTLVKLPEQNVKKALDILAKILIERKKHLSIIDLRLIPDKLYIEF